MKRMYVTLGVMFLLVMWAFSCLGQQATKPLSREEQMMKRMQMRDEVHRRIMEQLLKGGAPADDMFADMEKLMDETMIDAFSGADSFSSFTQRSSNFSMEWSENKEGRVLAVTPKTPEQQLDISVQNNMITIKGKIENKTQQGISVSEFNNSINVPSDCDSARVKMDHKDGRILLSFPFVGTKTLPKTERKPLPKSKSDVSI